jgi:hypothetical protein
MTPSAARAGSFRVGQARGLSWPRRTVISAAAPQRGYGKPVTAHISRISTIIRRKSGLAAKQKGPPSQSSYAAIGRSPACSSSRRNSCCGARHMVRYMSRKGSQSDQRVRRLNSNPLIPPDRAGQHLGQQRTRFEQAPRMTDIFSSYTNVDQGYQRFRMSQPLTNGSHWCIPPIEYRGQTSRCTSAKTAGGMLAPALTPAAATQIFRNSFTSRNRKT